LELPEIVHEIDNKKYALQVEMKDLLFNDKINIVCINCESVIDKNLLQHNIEYLEYNKNTSNGTKIINDLNKIPRIDMLIVNLTKSFKLITGKIQPKYIALINKKSEYIDGYEFYNNIYIKIDKNN